jgi:hypothetical protein
MGTRWTTLLLLLAAAIIGGVTALGLDRALHHGPPPVAALDPGHRRRPPFDPTARLARELGLSPPQQARFDSVLARQRDEIRETVQPRYDSIAERTSREIDSMLTPDQRRMMDSLRAGRPHGVRIGGHPPLSR